MWQPLIWHRQAAEGGNCDSQQELGDMCMRGQGVPKSMESMDQAEIWYQAAAERGHEESQYMASRLSEDVQTVIRYSTLAAAQGDLRAQCELGKLIDKKGSLIQSEAPMERAIYWYEKAARRGHQESQFLLSHSLIALAEDRYGDLIIPRYSPMPLSMYWAKQSTVNNDSHYNQGVKKEWVDFRNELQEKVKGGCVACPSTRVRIHCVDCQAVYYCGKPCQEKHREKEDHDEDCRRNIVFSAGTKINLHGLIKKPSLNGRVGTIKSFQQKGRRYAVAMGNDDENQILIKPDNFYAV
jgi:hypothetical protein